MEMWRHDTPPPLPSSRRISHHTTDIPIQKISSLRSHDYGANRVCTVVILIFSNSVISYYPNTNNARTHSSGFCASSHYTTGRKPTLPTGTCRNFV